MSFDSLIGQERLTGPLREAIRADRLAHALLIVGPSGSGKGMLATQIAKALLCDAAEGGLLGENAGGGCDACRACRLVEHGNHPDFGVFERRSEHSRVRIETARSLRDALALKPFSGRRKVAVLPEGNLLTEAAANCLLKTLEEPPGDSVVLLLADSSAEILPTILSRCQMLKMAPLSPAVIAAVLEREHDASPAQAAYGAAMAGGSLGRALELIGPDWYDMKWWVVEQFSGLTAEGVFTVTDELTARARRMGRSPAAFREVLCAALDFAAGLYRDAVCAGVGSSSAITPMHADQAERCPRHLDPETAAGMADRVLVAQEQIRANANPGLVLDALLIEIANRQTA